MADKPPRIRPATTPDEQWRAALKDRVLAAADTDTHTDTTPDAGTRDLTVEAPIDHVKVIHDPELGVTITACDIEEPDETNMRRVAAWVAALVCPAHRQRR